MVSRRSSWEVDSGRKDQRLLGGEETVVGVETVTVVRYEDITVSIRDSQEGLGTANLPKRGVRLTGVHPSGSVPAPVVTKKTLRVVASRQKVVWPPAKAALTQSSSSSTISHVRVISPTVGETASGAAATPGFVDTFWPPLVSSPSTMANWVACEHSAGLLTPAFPTKPLLCRRALDPGAPDCLGSAGPIPMTKTLADGTADPLGKVPDAEPEGACEGPRLPFDMEVRLPLPEADPVWELPGIPVVTVKYCVLEEVMVVPPLFEPEEGPGPPPGVEGGGNGPEPGEEDPSPPAVAEDIPDLLLRVESEANGPPEVDAWNPAVVVDEFPNPPLAVEEFANIPDAVDNVGRIATDVEDPPILGVGVVPRADDVVPTTAPEVLLPGAREDVLPWIEEVVEESESSTILTLAALSTLKI